MQEREPTFAGAYPSSSGGRQPVAKQHSAVPDDPQGEASPTVLGTCLPSTRRSSEIQISGMLALPPAHNAYIKLTTQPSRVHPSTPGKAALQLPLSDYLGGRPGRLGSEGLGGGRGGSRRRRRSQGAGGLAGRLDGRVAVDVEPGAAGKEHDVVRQVEDGGDGGEGEEQEDDGPCFRSGQRREVRREV